MPLPSASPGGMPVVRRVQCMCTRLETLRDDRSAPVCVDVSPTGPRAGKHLSFAYSPKQHIVMPNGTFKCLSGWYAGGVACVVHVHPIENSQGRPLRACVCYVSPTGPCAGQYLPCAYSPKRTVLMADGTFKCLSRSEAGGVVSAVHVCPLGDTQERPLSARVC